MVYYWFSFPCIVLISLTLVILDQKSYSRGIKIQFRKEEESRAFHCAFDQWKKELVLQGALSLSTYNFVQKSNGIY